jgi:hypothetical protein
MKNDIEYMNYPDGDRLSALETRAVELERMLGTAVSGPGAAGRGGPIQGTVHGGYDPSAVAEGVPAFEAPENTFEDRADPFGGAPFGPDGRTESLITSGRVNASRSRFAILREHWKAASAATGALAVLCIVMASVGSGSPPSSWPASVTRMQSQVASACANPDVAAEPTQVNFACGKGSQQVLWVFALLTSGGNPGYSDPVTGRRGLEPITPAQGGDVAWSLNLHAPYSPADAADSIEVAARAVNNIVAGATLTSASGQPSVQGGLESSAANCRRYTGSGQLLSRPGYPALCAAPLTAAGGQALVTDIFRQWMTGTAAQTATDAGVLFANAGNPGSAQVQKILASLPGSGQ